MILSQNFSAIVAVTPRRDVKHPTTRTLHGPRDVKNYSVALVASVVVRKDPMRHKQDRSVALSPETSFRGLAVRGNASSWLEHAMAAASLATADSPHTLSPPNVFVLILHRLYCQYTPQKTQDKTRESNFPKDIVRLLDLEVLHEKKYIFARE